MNAIENDRRWIEISPDGDPLRVFEWNVLAQTCTSGFVGAGNMSWARRAHMLRTHIIASRAADIMVLCEVDHFERFWIPLLTSLNKKALYVKKRPDADHGVVVAYDCARFEERAHVSVADGVAGIIMLLRDKVADVDVCVIGTHLKAKAPNAAVRDAQMATLLRYAAPLWRERVVLAGDLNTHSAVEPVLHRMAIAKLRSTFGGWTTWKRRENNPGVYNQEDYVFASRAYSVMSLLAQPHDETVRTNGLLPGHHYASDHLSLQVCLCEHQPPTESAS